MPRPSPDPGGPHPLGRPRRRPPDPRSISRLLYIAVALIALLLLYVAIRAALS
jgi:hypothetical protein